MKTYEYKGEKFTVSEPKDSGMEVTGKGITASITIHEATRMYRESLDGWGTDQPTLEGAIDRAMSSHIGEVEEALK